MSSRRDRSGPGPRARLRTPALTHEHVLVDFVGADQVGRHRYDADEAFRVALPHLQAVKQRGCRTLVECTPAYIGRDVALLRRLATASGLHILTNTGYYGAANDKFVPAYAYEETVEQLAVADLAKAGHLGQVLVSQDAGWYHVGEPGGGSFRPYTFLFDTFLPALRKAGLGGADTRRLMVDNPARALTTTPP